MRSKFFSIITALLLIVISVDTNAQDNENEDKFRYEAWRYGLHGALNYNTSGMGYQQLNEGDGTDFVPKIIDDGDGYGLYAGFTGEYLSDSWWGVRLRASFDGRDIVVTDETITPISQFDIFANYVSIEPQLRIDQNLVPNLYFTAGPMIAFLLESKYDYRPDQDQAATREDVDIDRMHSPTWGISGGFGYDIMVGNEMSTTRWYISPFVNASWLVNQRHDTGNPEQDEIDDVWGTVTVRAGAQLSFESLTTDRIMPQQTLPVDLSIETPAGNYYYQRTVVDYFPLINSVFFNNGNSEIPQRYNLLNRDEANRFNEDNLFDGERAGNLPREDMRDNHMEIYYNILNIYGSRLRDNPDAEVKIIGSAPVHADADKMANNVRDYFMNVFNISLTRMTVETQDQPVDPSGTKRTPPEDEDLVRQENRRVRLVFNDEDMNNPVKVKLRAQSMIENDLVVDINDRIDIRRWQLKILGDNGVEERYGPYESELQVIDPSRLLDDMEAGEYTARAVVTTKDGRTVTGSDEFRLVKKVVDKEKIMGKRYIILFDYAEANAVQTYEDFLRNKLAPLFKEGYRVVVYGHTDIAGEKDYNLELSKNRANEVERILEDEFRRANKNIDVQSMAFGERRTRAIFDNSTPEGRFYNRNVFIEVIPMETASR
ncbi:MAG: OmpA family protein [Candidatus Kapaibacterium sp.]